MGIEGTKTRCESTMQRNGKGTTTGQGGRASHREAVKGCELKSFRCLPSLDSGLDFKELREEYNGGLKVGTLSDGTSFVLHIRLRPPSAASLRITVVKTTLDYELLANTKSRLQGRLSLIY